MIDTLARLIDKMGNKSVMESFEDILSDVSKADMKCFMETASLIHEAAVSFSVTQAVVMKALATNPKVDVWAKSNVPGWDKMSIPAKVNAIASALGQSGFHAARTLASSYENNGALYELPDVDDPKSYQQIMDSKLGSELTELFIKLLMAGRADFKVN